MKRIIDHFLLEWKQRERRKPLLLRGARQVGKTYAVHVLGATFERFVEINLETNAAARAILEKDLDLDRIVLQLSELLAQRIEPGKTLLFFDEVQLVPQVIILLRYFYEKMPALHVVAAGSLLDFAIEQVGIPVGRISTLYMHPLSFLEFLVALGYSEWVRAIVNHTPIDPVSEPLHGKLLDVLGMYLAIGGMPEAVSEWIQLKESRAVKRVHAELIYTYQQDFGKYAKKHQIKHLNVLFLKIAEQVSNKFIFSRVGEYQKRELAPALDLLQMAGLIHKITRSAGQGIPIGAQSDLDIFKVILLDVGLSQVLLKLDITQWFIDPINSFINKGELVEAFIGQELLAYADPITKEELFYWEREVRGSDAEIDYLIQLGNQVVPIEVKAGTSKRIKSMHVFLDTHIQSSYGLRFWAYNYDHSDRVLSYPLYAVVVPLMQVSMPIREAIVSLIA